MIKDSLFYVYDYIKNTEIIVLLFVFAELTRILGFLPHISDIVVYGIMVLFSLYCIFHSARFSILYVMLLVYIPLEILLMEPNSMFNPWVRYILFAIIIINCTGMCISWKMIMVRSRIFEMTCFSCVFIGVGSFFGRFLGLNYMTLFNVVDMNATGLFGGLTTHSMLLGPAAGVGTIFIAARAFRLKKWYLWAMAACSLASVLFAASRSAFLATIAGGLVLVQLSSVNMGKFFKYVIVGFIILACTMPLWQDAMTGLIQKQNNNVAAGGAFSSREDKWTQRMEEFKSSPVFGYGFASVDPANKDHSIGAGGKSIESGSSWLSVLSMTGIIGFVLIMSIYMQSFFAVYNRSRDPLLLSTLTMLSVNMCTEGYIFFGGSFLAFLFWITIGVCSDQRYVLVEGDEK